jgi:hypothetical protein
VEGVACAAPALGGEERVGVHFGDWRATPKWMFGGGQEIMFLIGKIWDNLIAVPGVRLHFCFWTREPRPPNFNQKPNFPSLLLRFLIFQLYL